MEKVAALVNAEPPKTPRVVRAFLGGCDYFAKHIPQYAEFAALLTPLTRKKKDPTFEWKEEHDLAFIQIKEGLKLMIYNENLISNKPIHIVFSVRDKAYSAAIMQEDDTEPNKLRWPWMREQISDLVANHETCGRAKQDWKRSVGNRKHIKIEDINEYIFVDHLERTPSFFIPL